MNEPIDNDEDTADQPLKVIFAPGCFDAFEGTQEELAEMIAYIHRMVESGEMFDKGRIMDIDDPEDAAMIDLIESKLEGGDNEDYARKLQ